MEKLIAVYGTLKKGQSNHRVMGASELLGKAVTAPIFTMYTNGAYPALTLGGNTGIQIEVYKVTDPETLEDIYSLEGYNGVRNDPDNTFYDTTDVTTPYGDAEIFYFKDSCSWPVVETGEFQPAYRY